MNQYGAMVSVPTEKGKTMVIEYKGYVISQSDYNHHVMIIKDGHMVMHASCTRKMSEKELQNEVDMFLALTGGDEIDFDYEAEVE